MIDGGEIALHRAKSQNAAPRPMKMGNTAQRARIYCTAMQNPDFLAVKTIFRHFGSKDELLSTLRAWVSDKPERQDVATMFGPEAEQATSRTSKEGFVYLIKSGTHYKIGRSDEIERRVKAIRVALQKTANLVNSIRTDDPAAIEAYWHRPFADRRANGEWFKLSAADLTAFKRRKYQ